MFPFDQAALPQLTTRKALIVVDFQNDFIGDGDGALLVTEPQGFVNRSIELAAAFRAVGDVVWVQSRFDKSRPVDDDQIIVSDDALAPRPTSSRGRRRIPVEPTINDPPPGPADPEAFLSHDEPSCLRPSDPGCDMPPAVKEVVRKSDLTLAKTHYSAFQDTHLLHRLRGKMVMEVFICGSLANVGVYATAMDAAGHGMTITVVEDCCGYRHESRQIKAVKNLVELTGCDIASAQEVLDTIRPSPTRARTPDKPPQTPTTPATRAPAGSGGNTDVARISMSPDIVRPMTGLRLASGSPSPAAVANKASAASKASKASGNEPNKPNKPNKPKDIKQDDLQGESPPSKLQESIGTEMDNKTVLQSSRDVEPPATNTKDYDPHLDHSNRQTNEHQALPSNSPTPQSPPSSPPRAEPSPAKEDAENGISDQVKEDGLLLQNGLCEGDTDVIQDALPDALAQEAFEKLQHEVRWQRMSHQGGEVPRLVAVQGEVADDGSVPVYRHPADESPPLLPFSSTVLAIKVETEKHLGHPLNHVLIQFYRDGNDYISEHSDKTLDIVKGSYIANVSLGAERTMVLRTKRLDKDPSRTGPVPADLKRKIQRARLPHNSLCRMGLQTNMKWLHAIRQDKRADRDKSAAELAYSGGRISLTFRQIGTFLDRDGTIIWGQGAMGKTRDAAMPIINGQSPEAIKMLQAFGTENHASDFDWEAHYGNGYDVLHISNSPRFFTSADSVVNMRIALMLAEYGINYARGSMAPAIGFKDGVQSDVPVPGALPIKFVDNDTAKSAIEGDMAIMLYLDSSYGHGSQRKENAPAPSREELARRFTRFQQGLGLLDTWRRLSRGDKNGDSDGAIPKALKQELVVWDTYASETTGDASVRFIAGAVPSLPDFAVWPVLHSIWEGNGSQSFDGLDNLLKYYEGFAGRENVKKVLRKTIAASDES